MLRSKFTFTRLKYRSGDWNTDQRMPSNILNSLIEYTTIPINPTEKVVELSSNEVFEPSFAYLSGHKLVQFDAAEKSNFKNYVQNGGFVFVDDCNHDIDGLFARSFEAQMAALFGKEALKKIRNKNRTMSKTQLNWGFFFCFPVVLHMVMATGQCIFVYRYTYLHCEQIA